MSIEIIPAILINSFEEFDKKVRAVEPYTIWVQLDVADGDFAPSKTWGDPVMLHDYDTSVFIEAHLMVEAPELVIDDWITGRAEEKDSGMRRIYFHYEATEKHQELIKKIKDAGKEAGIALLPETPLELIMPFQNQLDAVLIFAGNLGFYGGEFNESVLDKISELRKINPNVIIEVDGGMNPETAKKAVEAGANVIVSGGYIWGHKEGPQKAIEELKKIVQA